MVDIQYGVGDYPEDATHENGNYMCVCVECGDNFIGHKRRVICKYCLTLAKNTEQANQPDNLPEDGDSDYWDDHGTGK